MFFTIICADKPGALETRLSTREAHLAYLTGCGAQLVHAGPMLDGAGKPCGSLLVVDVADRAAAEAFAAADPYAVAGLFESVVIREHRVVFRDGVQVA